MTLQRILGAATLTLVITAAYAATANDPNEIATAASPAVPGTAPPSVLGAASITTPAPAQGG
jgi:hypothetical protein